MVVSYMIQKLSTLNPPWQAIDKSILWVLFSLIRHLEIHLYENDTKHSGLSCIAQNVNTKVFVFFLLKKLVEKHAKNNI